MKAPDVIHTPRLRLRRPVQDDVPAIYAHYANDEQVVRHLSWSRHLSLADTRAFVEFSNSEWHAKSAGPYLIELQTDGRLIGSTGIAIESATRASVGYVLARLAWGAGYASEALQAMVKLAVQLGLLELYALCHPDNLATRRVLEKGGFKRTSALDEDAAFPNPKSTIVTAVCYLMRFEPTISTDNTSKLCNP